MNCYLCENQLIWGGDHDDENTEPGKTGMVTNLSCPNENCDVDLVLVYQSWNEQRD